MHVKKKRNKTNITVLNRLVKYFHFSENKRYWSQQVQQGFIRIADAAGIIAGYDSKKARQQKIQCSFF